MRRKPTPQELADFVTEDQYGLPMVSAQPGVSQDAYNAGPDFDQGGEGVSEQDQPTAMQQCAASACRHNRSGRCVLGSIEINERGGCQQYEATADDEGPDDGSGRYDETESDVSGGSPYQQMDQGGQERHWQTGKWDPRGGGY